MRHESSLDTTTLGIYQSSLDRVFAQSQELMPAAPTWQAALYQSVRACYTEMRSHPQALHMHFIATGRDPLVQDTRTRHRDRLLALLADVRTDAPPLLHAELMLSMIHATLRRQIATEAEPPPLDQAESAFAALLFNYEPVAH